MQSWSFKDRILSFFNRRFIKLGNYPDGYECNVGNIWIKKPINGKGYRMIHENEKGDHLIGYIKENGEKVEQ